MNENLLHEPAPLHTSNSTEVALSSSLTAQRAPSLAPDWTHFYTQLHALLVDWTLLSASRQLNLPAANAVIVDAGEMVQTPFSTPLMGPSFDALCLWIGSATPIQWAHNLVQHPLLAPVFNGPMVQSTGLKDNWNDVSRPLFVISCLKSILLNSGSSVRNAFKVLQQAPVPEALISCAFSAEDFYQTLGHQWALDIVNVCSEHTWLLLSLCHQSQESDEPAEFSQQAAPLCFSFVQQTSRITSGILDQLTELHGEQGIKPYPLASDPVWRRTIKSMISSRAFELLANQLLRRLSAHYVHLSSARWNLMVQELCQNIYFVDQRTSMMLNVRLKGAIERMANDCSQPVAV